MRLSSLLQYPQSTHTLLFWLYRFSAWGYATPCGRYTVPLSSSLVASYYCLQMCHHCRKKSPICRACALLSSGRSTSAERTMLSKSLEQAQPPWLLLSNESPFLHANSSHMASMWFSSAIIGMVLTTKIIMCVEPSIGGVAA